MQRLRLIPLPHVACRRLMRRRGKLDRIRSAVEQTGKDCMAEW